MTHQSALVLFDIDGTLLGTGGAGKVALNCAFESCFQIKGAFDEMSFVGSMDCKLFSVAAMKHLGRLFTPEEQREFISLYVQALQEEFHSRPFEVFDGVVDTLDALSENPNVFMGLATGNLHEAAWAKLRHGKLDGYFSTGGYGLSGPERLDMTRKALHETLEHHQLEIKECSLTLIGDSIYDIHCAKNLDMTAWGILTGWTGAAELETAGADRVEAHISAFPWNALLTPTT